MEFQTLAVLSAIVMVIVDRLRAVVPQVKGAWTNLIALVVGAAVSIVGDLGPLAADLVPAVSADAGLIADLIVGVILAGGSALTDQIRQIGAGSAGSSLDGQQ